MELLVATAEQRLAEYNISVDSEVAATVMAVAGGIEAYEKGIQLRVWSRQKRHCFSMRGLKKRVRNCDQWGSSTKYYKERSHDEKALQKAYNRLKSIHFKNINYRKDIGFDL